MPLFLQKQLVTADWMRYNSSQIWSMSLIYADPHKILIFVPRGILGWKLSTVDRHTASTHHLGAQNGQVLFFFLETASGTWYDYDKPYDQSVSKHKRRCLVLTVNRLEVLPAEPNGLGANSDSSRISLFMTPFPQNRSNSSACLLGSLGELMSLVQIKYFRQCLARRQYVINILSCSHRLSPWWTPCTGMQISGPPGLRWALSLEQCWHGAGTLSKEFYCILEPLSKADDVYRDFTEEKTWA